MFLKFSVAHYFFFFNEMEITLACLFYSYRMKVEGGEAHKALSGAWFRVFQL